jgi:hypothetical protein
MLFRIAILLAMLCALDAYFFNGRHVATVIQAGENFGTDFNSGISNFTRRLM